MMQFTIKALQNQQLKSFNVIAQNEQAALAQVKASGCVVLSVAATQTVAVLSGSVFANLRLFKPQRFPLILFSQELLSLLSAGLNLFESIEALAEKEQQPEIRRVLEGVLDRLKEGKTLSSALEQFSDAFPTLFVATLKASEKTGGIAESLKRFIAYQMQLETVKKKVVTATIYPAMLIVVGGLVTLFLLGYVVPKFAFIYEDMGGDLPFLSRLLLQFGQVINQHGLFVAIGLSALVVAVLFAFSQRAIKLKLLALIWQIPTIGEHFRVYQLARFYRTVGMLLTGGNTISASLSMVSGLLSPALQVNLQQAAYKISQGISISAAMEQHELTTPVALRMLRVGERSGQMGEMMERAASFYDDEIARVIDWATRLFEPLLMLLIGLVVGVVVLLLYMPIFELAGSIQ